MPIVTSGSISMLDIVKEFNTTEIGTVAGVLVNSGTSWAWTQAGFAAVGDLIINGNRFSSALGYGQVTSITAPPSGPGYNITVRWIFGPTPYIGMPALRAQPPFPINQYYRGGSFVPDTATNVNIPIQQAGPGIVNTISYSNFYGGTKQVVQTFYQPGAGLNTLTIPAGTWYVYAQAVGAGGGGGAGDAGVYGTNGGFGGSFRAKFTITATQTGRLALSTGWGGGAGVGQTRDGGGGGAGRSYSWTNTSDIGSIDNTGNPNFRSTYCYDGPNIWHPLLEDEAVWSGLFDQQGVNARVPVSVFFPTSGAYTVQGAADNDFYVFFDDPTFGYVGNFSGFSDVKQVVLPNVTAGWHTLYLGAQNYGGPQGIGLRILRTSDNLRIFNSRGITDGGFTSGNFWFLNGGEGGHAGRYGTSGAAGGGGSATGLLWYPNNDPLTGSPVILGIAPGGGGGAGTGRYINPTSNAGIYLANWNIRGAVVDSGSILTAAAAGGNSAWWTNRGVGNRVPYSLGTLKGHGGHNSAAFYPPSTENGWTNETGGWDGGAGGGGGAPWGYAGGYAEKGDSTWLITSSQDKAGNITNYWNAPNESSGAGGNQGFCFLNSNYVSSYQISPSNAFYTIYGAGGLHGYEVGNSGQSGAISVRISNVDDGIYPGI